MAQDNYRLQMEQAQARFLTYDQNRLMEKFSLQADGNYLYLSFLGTPHRLSRKTGSLEYEKDGHWQDGNTFSRVLTLLDILCDSKDPRCPSGVWQSMESFGRHVHQTLLAELDPMAEAFDKKVDHRLLIRRLGVNADKTTSDDGIYQLDLFTDYETLKREKAIQGAMLEIRQRYGKNAVVKGLNMLEGATTMERNEQIGGHKSGKMGALEPSEF